MLNAAAIVAMIHGASGGAYVFCGRSEERQRRGSYWSRCPVMIVSLSGLHTWTECFVNRNLQSSSQIFPMPSK